MIHLLYTIIVGGVVGWLASLIMKTGSQMGILANIVVGIVGSWLGSWLIFLLGFGAYGIVAHFIVRILGASILIGILKSMRFFK